VSESTPSRTTFSTAAGVPLTAAFDGGRLTSDGGLPWLAEVDSALGLCDQFATCLPPRQRRGRHPLPQLLRQRIFQIACGYTDQNDATSLRHDPLFKLVCGRLPDSDPALASQATFSRLENRVDRRSIERLATVLAEVYLAERACQGRPQQILLDFDGTDDPAHGKQEGVRYHGFYGQHMYHPLLVFDGDTGQLITAVLRPGNAHGRRFVRTVLRRLVPRLRAAWPGVRIELRADSGFAVPEIYRWCEAHDVHYTIGPIPNARLEREAAPLLAAAQAQSDAAGGTKVRLAGATTYQAGTWDRKRRVVYKAEILGKGPNTRFVVTDHPEPPLEVYDYYVDRGQCENHIKDFKNALACDRLSDHRFVANQFRLLLHAAAYCLLHTLRRWLAGTELATAQFDTLRLRLLKIGGRVRERLRGVRLHLASSHPSESLWRHLAARRPLMHNPG
jgi:Transposase DDE domain group 1